MSFLVNGNKFKKNFIPYYAFLSLGIAFQAVSSPQNRTSPLEENKPEILPCKRQKIYAASPISNNYTTVAISNIDKEKGKTFLNSIQNYSAECTLSSSLVSKTTLSTHYTALNSTTSVSDSDKLFCDPAFLASVKKIEEAYYKRKQFISSPEKNLEVTISYSSESITNGSSVDPFFSNPAVLAAIDKAEKEHLSKKAIQLSQKNSSSEINVNLLNSFEEHQIHLLNSIQKAKKSILLTSHNFSASMKSHPELFYSLRAASLRNVKIYLYFNKDHVLNDSEIQFLEETGIRLSNPIIHSKLLIIDKNLITCGSFDWLSNTSYTRYNKESSMVLSGENLQPFVEEIWETLKKYVHLSYRSGLESKYEKVFENTASYVMNEEKTEDEIELLTIPHQHDDFFLDSLETAQHRIALCAPFISKDLQYLQDILPKDKVRHFLESDKILHIFYRSNDSNIYFLRQYLKDVIAPNLILSSIDNLHRKTLIVDDTYSEGSFNWLSSARSLDDDFTLMETSFVLKGPKAKTFIQDFYCTIKK